MTDKQASKKGEWQNTAGKLSTLNMETVRARLGSWLSHCPPRPLRSDFPWRSSKTERQKKQSPLASKRSFRTLMYPVSFVEEDVFWEFMLTNRTTGAQFTTCYCPKPCQRCPLRERHLIVPARGHTYLVLFCSELELWWIACRKRTNNGLPCFVLKGTVGSFHKTVNVPVHKAIPFREA